MNGKIGKGYNLLKPVRLPSTARQPSRKKSMQPSRHPSVRKIDNWWDAGKSIKRAGGFFNKPGHKNIGGMGFSFGQPPRMKSTSSRRVPKKNMNYRQAKQFYNLKPLGDADRDGVSNARDCKPFNPFAQDVSWTYPGNVEGAEEGEVVGASFHQDEEFELDDSKAVPVDTDVGLEFDSMDSDVGGETDLEYSYGDSVGEEKPPTGPSLVGEQVDDERDKVLDDALGELEKEAERDKPPFTEFETGKEKTAEPKFAEAEQEVEQEDDKQDVDTWYVFVLTGGKWENWGSFTREEVSKAAQEFSQMPGVEDTKVSQRDILRHLNTALGLHRVGKAFSKVGDYGGRQDFKGNFRDSLKLKRPTVSRGSTDRALLQRTHQGAYPGIGMRPVGPAQTTVNVGQQPMRERVLPPVGSPGAGRVHPYSPVTVDQSMPQYNPVRPPYQQYSREQRPEPLPDYWGGSPSVQSAPQQQSMPQDYWSQNQDRRRGLGLTGGIKGLSAGRPSTFSLSGGGSGKFSGGFTNRGLLNNNVGGGMSSRPRGFMPIADIKFMKFGRRLDSQW